MKKSFIVWMGIALMMTAGMSSCSSDDEEKATGYDYLYHVSYFDQDPNLNKQQGYWYDETFIGLTPPEGASILLGSNLGQRGGRESTQLYRRQKGWRDTEQV